MTGGGLSYHAKYEAHGPLSVPDQLYLWVEEGKGMVETCSAHNLLSFPELDSFLQDIPFMQRALLEDVEDGRRADGGAICKEPASVLEHQRRSDDELENQMESTVQFAPTPEQQRSIVRRIDRRLVVTVGAMYCVSLMDRANMSAANIAGMGTELRLEGVKYNTANLLFFIPYIIFQPPSTVLVRRIGARLHLASITLLWGAVTVGMGFVVNFGQLAGLRVLLGFLEAGFFPSCVYLLSTWYTRYEVGKRYSLFYLLGSVASALTGILAYGASAYPPHAPPPPLP
ncbi:hypothetical protein RJ55_04644 [Drechmeria coniospora]|nr:hypothetical protein RJ55_04644 [Drechmeria coniospora]